MFATSDVLIDGLVAGVLAAAFVLVIPWARRRGRFGIAGLATFLGFIAFNLVISHAKAAGLDVDAPVVALSWQDVGSGVLAFGATALALGVYERDEKAGRLILTAAVAGIAAMVWDIFVL
jgi:hypothetical protein